MSSLVSFLVLIPILDQGLKALLLRLLGARAIPLGPVGQLRVVRAQVWMVRGRALATPATLWTAWIAAAVAIAGVTALLPSTGLYAGLLLGGSLSHVIETSRRGWVCDYVCLRFWPAFNLADVALTAGALGLGLSVVGTAFR